MDRWEPMPGYVHRALRGNGYHDALGGRGARALRIDSTLRRPGERPDERANARSAARGDGGVGVRRARDASSRRPILPPPRGAGAGPGGT